MPDDPRAGHVHPEMMGGQPTDEPTEADPPALSTDAANLRVLAQHLDATPAAWVSPLTGRQWTALLRRIAAGLVGGRSAAPTRDELRALIAEAMDPVGFELETVDEATDAVLGLLSRSAAEPPEDEIVLGGSIEVRQRNWSGLALTEAEIRSAAEGIDMAGRITPVHIPTPDDGVPAEPNEKATDE